MTNDSAPSSAQAAPGCAAGVFVLEDEHGLVPVLNCWYKDEVQVAHKGGFQGWPKLRDVAHSERFA